MENFVCSPLSPAIAFILGLAVIVSLVRDYRKGGIVEMKLKQITREQAKEIIENRKPLGKFCLVDGNKFVGIDNTDGNTWTEDFKTFEECMKWLKREVDCG